MNIEQLKNNINIERKKRGKTIEQVCRGLGKSRYWISKLQNPTLETINDIAYSIGCSCADLMRDD